MRQFIKTIVPTDGYTEVKQVGSRYVVHLEGVQNPDDGTTTCYECMMNSEPDMAVLQQELAEYKAYIGGVELKMAKEAKIKELTRYDSSSAVNGFTYSGVEMWLDKATRAGLMMRLTAEQAAGKTMTTLWYGTHGFELGISDAFQLLYAIEVYASQCYDKTAEHGAEIEALTTMSEVENYDITAGYPQKLSF